jgi:hypothetical protein
MKRIINLSLILLVLFASCKKEKLTANGNIISETRNLTAFTGVQTSGSSPIHIVYGNEYKVVIKGSGNLIPSFESNIIGSKLHLNFKNVNVGHNDIEVTVTMPTLKSISLSGSAKIDVTGNFPLIDFMNISLSGSGEIAVKNILTATEVDIEISGSGLVNFEKLLASYADISISGSGDARISAIDKLIASISGSGKVYYTGNPTVDSHISGSGKVIKF